jgi:hypothetical protein
MDFFGSKGKFSISVYSMMMILSYEIIYELFFYDYGRDLS